METSQGNPDMNLDAEIAKTEERLAAVSLDADKLRATQAKPDYEKTPAAVKEANADKVCPAFIAVGKSLNITLFMNSFAA
jgi:hypothetical protein